jgi:hypothetical protein
MAPVNKLWPERCPYTLIVVNNPEFSQKIVAEGINKNDFVSHMPPKWNLENDIKIMKNLVRTGATRLTDRVPFAPQQSLDFVEERIGYLGQSGDAQRAR